MTSFVEWADIASLVTRAQRGDRDAYGELSEQFRPTVYAMALARLRDPNEAQELTQDVLVHAYVKLGQLRHPAAFAGWLRQITARMAVNRVLRRGAAGAGGESGTPALDSAPARTASPVESLINREEAEQVRKGLDRLNPMDRETLMAFYFRGQSLDQMSREHEAPIGTIKRRLHVARNRLRRELECVAV
jgi:RNA polymerase sigma-70 factor (ECF subfamily)